MSIVDGHVYAREETVSFQTHSLLCFQTSTGQITQLDRAKTAEQSWNTTSGDNGWLGMLLFHSTFGLPFDPFEFQTVSTDSKRTYVAKCNTRKCDYRAYL